MPWLMRTNDIETVALTRGSRGSTVYTQDAQFDSPSEKVDAIVDTVGAGDAYAAILAAGHIKKLPWKETIGLASTFASLICGIPGALPDDPTFYDHLRSRMEGNDNDG